MSLLERLKAEIAATGPISVADYMSRCLHDPQDGYYATRPALGPDGDFITAPLVSQMFGELIGLWCVEIWIRLGRPEKFHLVEVGPGDGTLMSDLLRAGQADPGFLPAAELWLVETSEPLRERQAERLADGPVHPQWAWSLSQVPGGFPVILVANELLDCLPVRQFVHTDDGWVERLVGLDEDGSLIFGLAPVGTAKGSQGEPGSGMILEVSAAQEALGAELGAMVVRDGGAALLIDYGRAEAEFGDTLQALEKHEKVDPLARPGHSDLTVHADFPTVLTAAQSVGAAVGPILPQGAFLGRLGIEARVQALQAARPDKAELIHRQFLRLAAPTEMGELFKVVCIHSAGLEPPGSETPV
ncbi:MAG: SAM-dependent methyltransferase [Caulobacter sp.]|nr:SAM-dependent methyltransferase [Caulobacter sp.]